MLTKILIAVALAGSSYAMAYDRDASMVYFEQQVGLQRKIVVETEAALDKAIETKNNSVHLSKDVIDSIAYGVSSGVITYDFLKGTNNVEAVRNLFTGRKGTTAVVTRRGAEGALAADAAKAEAAGATDRAIMLRKMGATAYRTTQAVSAAVLGVLFVGDLYQVGNDVVIKFSDTREIAQMRANLAQAQRNLRVADQNLQTAALAN